MMNNFIFENATKTFFGRGCVREYLCCLSSHYGNITNPGALKIVLGTKNFLLYLVYVMLFAFITGLVVVSRKDKNDKAAEDKNSVAFIL